MASVVINFRADANVKKAAQRAASEMGLSLSSIMKAGLHHLIKTKSPVFLLEVKKSKEAWKWIFQEARRINRKRIV